MNFKNLSDIFSPNIFSQIQQWIKKNPSISLFNGFAGSFDSFFISALFLSEKRTILVSSENSKSAERIFSECSSIIGEKNTILIPSRDAVPYNLKSPFGPVTESRLKALSCLMNGKKAVYIVPHAALLQKVPSRQDLFNKIIRLEVGREISIETLSFWLTDNGFRRETIVNEIGTFCVRGGIVDIYPFLYESPIRLEFFGNVIESIREFDVFSQKTSKIKSNVEIFPMKEFYLSPKHLEEGIQKIYKSSEKQIQLKDDIAKLSHQWQTLHEQEGIEWFIHWFDVKYASLFDYFSSDSIIIWDDMLPPSRRFEECYNNYERHLERIPQAFLPFISTPDKLLFEKKEIENKINQFQRIFIDTKENINFNEVFYFEIAEQPPFTQSMEDIKQNLNHYAANGYQIYMVCSTKGVAERFCELLFDDCPFVLFVVGLIYRGFIDKINKVVFYTDSQIFGTKPSQKIIRKKITHGMPISSYDALTCGDYVVHIDHGIGKFVGIEQVSTLGAVRDCMVILYQDKAKLSVPIEDFHKVQKYIGKESITPVLSKLGTATWEKIKAKTKEALKEMAKDLLELYAKRQYFEGIQFSKDTIWQKEFEDTFIYEETEDQMRAIEEVKKDMESKRPMDRLICGDVGFGKTEVAMRAAFKAVMDGYQVAVLAPTTILVAQHFATFTQRMANFPVKIAMLSRFLSKKEQKLVTEKIKNGEVDIIIGTHRILSKDILFKNLGLLIIDEEQRFGVRHKEHLKKFKYKVDVLSLTATPIPRTLHMSLIGARDLSIINTPPQNRLPIETHVMEYHDEIVKMAIENELERGGQVYVVYNRIQTLEDFKNKIETLVPQAKVICAHGQMDENQLARIMKEFVAGRFDVLVSTVIIENGLDIPNVNTIIVTRADTMGLAQLYQLRGRVGRSSEQAFAYLLVPSFREIKEVSLKRLKALEQYTELGSGFQVAMRDLEIRGAGNILGHKQHGFIIAVGFELYCKMLEETIKELKGEVIQKEPEKKITIDIPLEAYIPTYYVEDSSSRILLYQKLSSAKTEEEIQKVEKEILDRFGPMPEPVIYLMILMRLKIIGINLGCSKISINNSGNLTLFFEGNFDDVKNNIKKIFTNTKRRFEIINANPVQLITNLFSKDVKEQAKETLDFLSKFK